MTNANVEDINITDKAVKQALKLMEESQINHETHGLRVGVKGGGCSGMTYKLGFDEKVNDGDTVIEKDGLKLFVDGKSLFYLMGTTLDYSDGLNGKGFVFNNPNATRTCGCGESFAI